MLSKFEQNLHNSKFDAITAMAPLQGVAKLVQIYFFRPVKHRNIFVAGPADCAKTFILAPLQKIFITFSNPADNKYSWLDVENAEVIFLNNFRWSPDSITWKELLLLLEEGERRQGMREKMFSKKCFFAHDCSCCR